jgi:hypothetical protein
MSKDVFLIAYANDQDNPIEKVKAEAEVIQDLLKKNNEGEIEVHLIPDANVEKIWHFFEQHYSRIIAFHFAGHANGSGIFLDKDQQATTAALAGLMMQAKKMKFVFLNGCATKPLVTYLHKAGVQSIIATSSAINDVTAYDFAVHFYSPLSSYWTIGAAFNFAKSFVITRPENARSFLTGLSRQIGIPLDVEENGELPWGIYYNPAFNVEKDGDEDLIKELADWTLPDSVAPLDAPANYDPNYDLIETIAANTSLIADKLEPGLVEAANKNPQKYPDIIDLISLKNLHEEQVNGEAENIASLANIIIRLLPYPLGVLLRRMVTTSISIQQHKTAEDYYDMLNLQIQLYGTLLRLYSYTMLSSLWDVLEKRNAGATITINRGQLDYLNSFFDIDKGMQEEFDYASFTRVVREILEKNTPHPFISEYENVKQSFEKREEFYQSHLFIQGLKYKLRNDKVNELLYPGLCSRMEKELCNVFNTVFFILRYKLVVIKDIEIIRGRYSSTIGYQHRRTILHQVDESLSEKELIFTSYTDSYSVLFIRGRDDLKEYLSLSPFIIDKSALTGYGNSMLYFFSHKQNDAYIFECLDDPRNTIPIEEGKFDYLKELNKKPFELKKIENRFLEIKSQFQAFRNQINTLQTS